MNQFKIWLENDEKDKNKQLEKIWSRCLVSLNDVKKRPSDEDPYQKSDEDPYQKSLSKIHLSSRGSDKNNSTFKGKHAVLKRLESSRIFSDLTGLKDPDIDKNVILTKNWLGIRDETSTNASSTVGNLLQKLFGQDNFIKFVDADLSKQNDVKAQVPQMPPKQNITDNPNSNPNSNPNNLNSNPNNANSNIDNSMNNTDNPPMSGMMGQQPQANTNMPQKPAGSELGLF